MIQEKQSTDSPAGTEIVPPGKGKVFPWLARRTGLVQMIGAATSWLNLTVIVKYMNADGTSSFKQVKPVYTPKNSTLTLPIDLTNVQGTGSGTVPFSGTGAPAAGSLPAGITFTTGPYPTIPSLYVDLTALILYVCTGTGDNTNSSWQPVGSANPITMWQVQSDGGDYLNCKSWDGANLGAATVKIYKPPELRVSNALGIQSEAIRGTTYNYSYTNLGGYFSRTVKVNNVVIETDIVIPDYLPGKVIFACSNLDVTLAGGTGIDINASGRAWAQ